MNIQERCVVVVLSSALPGQYRKDKRKSREVCAEAGASEKAGRWSNCVWPEEAIIPSRKAYQEAREILYKQSVPWLADGQRLCLTWALLKLRPDLDAAIQEFNGAADESAACLDEWKEQSKRDRNGLFREADYPKSPAQFRKQFKLAVQYLPVPAGEHIVCQLADDDLRVLREGVQSQVSEALEAGRQDVIERLAEPLRAMVGRLRDPDAIFRDTLVSNIADIAAVLPSLNLTEDAGIAAIGADCHELGRVNPQTLRDVPAARATVADRAARALAKLEGLR